MAMKVLCLGGGPAGLYFAISMKLRDPAHQVTVLERNRANDTFGWGVVLSDDALSRMEKNDPVSTAAIRARWDCVSSRADTSPRRSCSRHSAIPIHPSQSGATLSANPLGPAAAGAIRRKRRFR